MAPYSGMATAIKKWGIGDTVTQNVELRWQQGVAGEKSKIAQFQEVAGSLQEFKTYLFMKPGSAFCTVAQLGLILVGALWNECSSFWY